MIVKLDIRKTYGIPDIDVAKKNKINKISLNKNIVSSSVSESSPSITQVLSSSDNNQNKIISTSYKNRYIYLNDFGVLGGKILYTPKFPSYIGVVLYKDYNITIDTTQPQYSGLSGVYKEIPFNIALSGNIYKGKVKSYRLDSKFSRETGDGDQYGVSYETLVNDLESTDIVSGYDNLTTNGFWGKTSWDFSSSIIDNSYNESGNTINAYDEILSTIQEGANLTSKVGDPFLELTGSFNAKIKTWERNGDNINITIQLPYAVYFLKSLKVYQKYENLGWDIVAELFYENTNIIKYSFSSVKITFETSGDITTEKKSYFDGKREYNVSNSFLFSNNIVEEGTPYIIEDDKKIYEYQYDKNYADFIYKTFRNGKTGIKLSYPTSEIVDTMGFEIYYAQQTGLVKKIGEDYFDSDGNLVVISDENPISDFCVLPEGTLCVITNADNNLFVNENNTPKLFYIQNSNLTYSGTLLNEIELVESSESPVTNLDSLSWSEIDAIGKTGKLQDYFNVGDKKYIYIDGNASNPVPLVVLGFNHDDLSNGLGKAGMTFGMESVLNPIEYKFNNTQTYPTSWKDCDFRNIHVNELMSKLPRDLQNVIKTVNKKSILDNTTNIDYDVSQDKIFLLSLTEIIGSDAMSSSSWLRQYFGVNEGTQYEYWRTIKDGTIPEDRQKLDYVSASTEGEFHYVPVSWSVRSLQKSSSSSTLGYIGSNGEIIGGLSTTNNMGISFAFCVGEEPFEPTPLQECSWETISNISNAGIAEDVFTIGEEKTITINNESYDAVIIGFNHDELSNEDGKAGITFALKQNLSSKYKMNQTATTVGGWQNSYFRTTILPTIFTELPLDLKSVIKTVNKSTGGGYGNYNLTTTEDKLWLLSVSEIVGENPNELDYVYDGVYDNEGTQYKYWRSVKKSEIRQDRLNGAGISYNPNDYEDGDVTGVTRSPEYRTNRDGGFIKLASSGDFASYSSTSNFDVFLCFCV